MVPSGATAMALALWRTAQSLAVNWAFVWAAANPAQTKVMASKPRIRPDEVRISYPSAPAMFSGPRSAFRIVACLVLDLRALKSSGFRAIRLGGHLGEHSRSWFQAQR